MAERFVYDPPALTGAPLVEWSLSWEDQWGNDSIPTIENLYERTSGGAILCVWPGCKFARNNPTEMWMHVHFSPRHVAQRKAVEKRHNGGQP